MAGYRVLIEVEVEASDISLVSHALTRLLSGNTGYGIHDTSGMVKWPARIALIQEKTEQNAMPIPSTLLNR